MVKMSYQEREKQYKLFTWRAGLSGNQFNESDLLSRLREDTGLTNLTIKELLNKRIVSETRDNNKIIYRVN